MTNSKHTKKALLSSVIALILCCSMLIGTTFAWFTDSVTSGVNQITAGNLDVELYHTNDAVTDEKVTTTTELFTDVELWEPGVVAYETLTVKNEGNLALKYQMSVNFENETVVNDHGLSEALKVGVVEGALGTDTTRTGLVGSVTEWMPLSSFVLSGELEKQDDANTVTIVIYWEPGDNEFDNLFNMNNENQGKTLSIDLGINLVATQLMSEEDSFGPDYDEGAYLLPTVYNAAELASALENGESVKLGADITTTERFEIPADATVVIDLNGYSITSDSSIVLYNMGDLTITGEGSVESTYSNYAIRVQSGRMVIDSADISVKGSFGAISIFNGAEVTINGGSYYAKGINGMTSHTVYVKDSTLVVNGGTFDSGYSNEGIGTITGSSSTVILNDGIFYASELGKNFYMTNTVINGGSYQYDPTTLAANKNIVVNGIVTLNEETGLYDVTLTDAYLKDLISGAEEGDAIYLPAGEYTLPSLSGKTGITIEGFDGTVIGGENVSTGFGSNFGNGNTYKNLTFSGSSNGVRYSYAQGGTITFDNCTFEGDSTYGFHMDESKGATLIFNSCTFSGFNAFASDLVKVEFNSCTFLSNGNYGHTNIWSTGEFNNCTWGDNTSVSTRGDNGHLYFNGVEESYHHEFIGSAESLVTFAESVNEDGDSWSGQAVVLVDDIDLSDIDWEPIGQTGSTEFKGIFDGQNYTISNLTIDSTEETSANYSSGLFGWTEDHGTGIVIKNVNIDGATVKGNHNVAVIVGYTYDADIINCHVTNATIVCSHANEEACGDKAGIIAGYSHSAITGCSATDSTVTAGRDAGQLVGAGYTDMVTVCTATNVTVTAGSDCTGANIRNEVIGRVLG